MNSEILDRPSKELTYIYTRVYTHTYKHRASQNLRLGTGSDSREKWKTPNRKRVLQIGQQNELKSYACHC